MRLIIAEIYYCSSLSRTTFAILNLVENLIPAYARMTESGNSPTLPYLYDMGSLEEYYDGIMAKLLPLTFLTALASFFGLVYIVIEIDPTLAHWYILVLFVLLIFIFLFNFLGLVLYFIRTRFYKHYSSDWYFKTSFKMALFIALFAALVTTLAILELITTFNIILAILAVSLLAFWAYLGKRSN